MTTDLQDGEVGTTPAPRDERSEYEQWRFSADGICAMSALGNFSAWQARAALAESELAEVRDALKNSQELLGRASHERDHQYELKLRAREQRDSFTTELEELRAELERVKKSQFVRLEQMQHELQKGRIWTGMGYAYTGLAAVYQQRIADIIDPMVKEAAIGASEGEAG